MAGGGGDLSASRLRQVRNQGHARGTGGSPAAPQPQFAVFGECPADRGEIPGLIRQGSGRPFAPAEANPAGGAVGDHMHGVEIALAL
jgi:hypothetical protein